MQSYKPYNTIIYMNHSNHIWLNKIIYIIKYIHIYMIVLYHLISKKNCFIYQNWAELPDFLIIRRFRRSCQVIGLYVVSASINCHEKFVHSCLCDNVCVCTESIHQWEPVSMCPACKWLYLTYILYSKA